METQAEKQAVNDEGSVQCVRGKGDDMNYQNVIKVVKKEKIKREPKEKAQTAENELINGRVEEE